MKYYHEEKSLYKAFLYGIVFGGFLMGLIVVI